MDQNFQFGNKSETLTGAPLAGNPASLHASLVPSLVAFYWVHGGQEANCLLGFSQDTWADGERLGDQSLGKLN